MSITSFHVLEAHLQQRAVAGDAGIVDEDVDRAELGLDLRRSRAWQAS